MGWNMLQHSCQVAVLVGVLMLPSWGHAQDLQPKQADAYDVLLHSRTLTDQHTALAAVMHDAQKYVPRIQRSLRDYPRLLRTDGVAANRAVYISALVRDPSFPPILVKNLGNASVLDECIYACPVVFALTVQASFAGWRPPSNLNSKLTTVHDLQSSIGNVSRLSLKVGSIDDVVQGPWVERRRKELVGKTEEELIQMAGPTSKSIDTRLLAAHRLETLVTDSTNRIKLYLLALNEVRDASGEYRDAVYQAIYRAELAKARPESVPPKH
jgi:hypothetical protein